MPGPDNVAIAADEQPVGGRLDRPTRGVVIGLLIVFVVTIAVMFLLRSDANWDRMVYVFSGLEAIVFAGAGALFGTTVQRGAVATARAEAAKARSDAGDAQKRAEASMETAKKGEALAAMVKAAAAEAPQPGAGQPQAEQVRRGARPDGELAGAVTVSADDPTVQRLARMAGELFPG